MEKFNDALCEAMEMVMVHGVDLIEATLAVQAEFDLSHHEAVVLQATIRDYLREMS